MAFTRDKDNSGIAHYLPSARTCGYLDMCTLLGNFTLALRACMPITYHQLYYLLYNSFAIRQVDDNLTNASDKSTRKFLVDGSTNDHYDNYQASAKQGFYGLPHVWLLVFSSVHQRLMLAGLSGKFAIGG